MISNHHTNLKSVLFLFLTLCFLIFPIETFASKYLWKAEDIAKNQSKQTQLTINGNQVVGTVDNSQIRSMLLIKNSIESAIGGNRQYTLYLTEDSDPNAFATTNNGENIIVFTLGMLRMADSDVSMLAAVMGHEVGHHIKNHLEESYRTNMLVGLAQVIIGAWLEQKTQIKYHVQNLGIDISSLGAAMVSSKFSRDQEREADAVGFKLMIQAGYDPDGALRLHERLKRYGVDGIPFLATHPESDERIQNIRQMIAGNPEAVKLARMKSHESETLAQNNQIQNPSNLQSSNTTSSDYSKAVAAMLNKDYATALAIFKTTAVQGDLNSCVHLAYMYRFGTGVQKSEVEAIHWYQKAAAQGNVAAIAALSEMGARYEPEPPPVALTSSSADRNYDRLSLILEKWDGYLTIVAISPNAKTSLKVSDRIDKAPSFENRFEGTGIYTFDDYYKYLNKYKIGDQVMFKVLRNGETVYSSAILLQ